MLLVQCANCSTTAFAQNHQNPDAELACDCCTEDHDHAAAANEAGEPCRPVIITVPPGDGPRMQPSFTVPGV